MNGLRILISGGTGFIGSHLAEKLASLHKVGFLLRASSGRKLPAFGQLFLLDGSYNNLRTQVMSFKPDVVIHLASLFLGTHKPEDVDHLIESNVRFPTQLIEASLAAGCREFINTGTAWQHYENAPYAPVNLYAATKQAFADILTYYVEIAGFKALTLELTDTYGPNDTRPKLLTLLKKAAQSGEPLSMSPGEQIVDFVHVSDVVAGYEQALSLVHSMGESEQRTYMLRSNRPLKLKAFLDIYNKISKKPVTISWGEKEYRPREIMRVITCHETLPGWRPSIDLPAGLRQLLEA
ncbi:MAG: NAD-dependent epimerase/dehydratase family protein [Bdellovibrionales bacterium]